MNSCSVYIISQTGGFFKSSSGIYHEKIIVFFDTVNVYFKFLNIVVSDLRRCEYVDKFKNKVKLLKKKGFIQLYT